MSSDSIIYLCINLPQAVERRRDVADQAARLGLDVHFVPAISGKELPPHVPDYDHAERRKSYHYDLTPNLITTYNPNSENSYIGPRGEAHAGGKRSLLQYLRYRLSVMSISRAKKRMIRLMQQRLRRVEAH